MAKATSSRESSSKTEASVHSDTFLADSQIGNAENAAKKVPRQHARFSPFLTGSASQTKIDVTLSKQTTEKFLTGARMHISVSPKPTSNRELTMRQASASRAMRGICFALSNREHLELEHAPTN
jgi:hypothetical protein